MKLLKYRAGPNDPDTSPNNWSPLNQGCERYRFISGADEIALNAEMGLYRFRGKSVHPDDV